LTYDDEREAEAVTKAVSPDNVRIPPYLYIETARLGKEVITKITCEENRLGTFISTIDDLLGSVSAVERVFSTVKRLA